MDKRIWILLLIFPALGSVAHTAFATEEMLKSADGFYKSRDYGKAEEIYREIFISNMKGPLAERAVFGMARSDFKLKRYSEARLNLQRFLMAYPQSVYVNEAFLFFGYILMYDHKLDDALHYFERVGGALKPKADIGRAEVALKRNDVAAAESIIAAADKKELKGDPRALYVQAAIFGRKGMHKEAVAAIGKIFDVQLKEEDLRAEKASIYFDASRLDDAEKICMMILDDPVSNREKEKAQKILAGVYERKGKVDEALQMYAEVSPFEMDDSVKMAIARLYDKKGDSGDALRYLSLLRDKRTRSKEVENKLGQMMAVKDPNAVECLVKFSSSIDKDSPFIITAAQYLIDNGKKFEGAMMLKRAQSGVEKGEASLATARILLGEGKYNEAKKNAASVMLENRYFAEASLILAEISTREGDLGSAISALTKAEKYSKDIRIVDRLADLYMETGNRAEALKYYKIASDKGDALASLNAGDLFYLSGDLAQAGTYYKRALSLGISDQKSLQWAYYQYGKLTGNKEYMNKAAQSGGIVGEAAEINLKRQAEVKAEVEK